MESRLKELKEGEMSICLGGKKLFKAQYNLEENGYSSHEEWLEDWREARTNRIFYIGSSDEKFGNQNCQLINGTLQVRVIPALEERYGKYVFIKGVELNYGREEVNDAILKGKAISYRFVRKERGWYVHITVEREEAQVESSRGLGAIGVDLNASHIDYAEINWHGNLVGFGRLPVQIQDRREEQVEAQIGDRIKEIVEKGKETGKPIVIEELEFSKKKGELEDKGTRYRRMISYFAYRKFHDMIVSRAKREGIEVIEINPAYTSVIGRYKYSEEYGISEHIGAGLAIARRGLNLSERLPANNALSLAEHRHRHVWSIWRLFKNAVSNRELGVGRLNRLKRKRPRLVGTSPRGDSPT